jgi:hypothetical protein
MRFFRTRPSADVSDMQREVAELFVETAAGFGVTFDYSEGSVNELEAWADHLWDPGTRPSEDALDSNSKLIGAYLGEVMIRHVGGHWEAIENPRQIVVVLDSGLEAHVLNKAYKRQVNGRSDSLVEFYKDFKSLATKAE